MDYRFLLPLRFPSLWPIKSAMDVILPRSVLIPTVIRRDNRSNLTKETRRKLKQPRPEGLIVKVIYQGEPRALDFTLGLQRLLLGRARRFGRRLRSCDVG